MNTHTPALISQLSDQHLVAQVKLLAQRERESMAALIAHLVVLDERGLYRGEGCSSLFMIRESITDRPEGSRDHIPCSRHIPAAVKRAVWKRDGGQCAFVAQNGRRCSARALLEFHHVAPHAAGGEPTVENIQLRCRAHNAYEAELYFGRNHYLGIRSNRRGGTDTKPPVATFSTRSGPSSKPVSAAILHAQPL